MKEQIEEILAMFPEVKWDRWAGELDALVIFGWIPREDGRYDFLTFWISNGKTILFSTSSSKYSADFAKRLGFLHTDCKRVSDTFIVADVLKMKQETI